MTAEQVREVVKITLDELMKANLLKTEDYQYTLNKVEPKLQGFFNGTYKDCIGISNILHQLSDDPYIDVIFLQYRDRKTLEWIAEYFTVDVSTIKRNKKRLIYKIYELMEVE